MKRVGDSKNWWISFTMSDQMHGLIGIKRDKILIQTSETLT